MQLCDTQGCCIVCVPCKVGGLGVRLNDAMYLTTQPWAVHDSEAWKAPLLICNAIVEFIQA